MMNEDTNAAISMNRLRQSAALTLLAFLAGSLAWTQTHAAMMYVRGSVQVNGSGVEHSSAIFTGDKLQVPLQSAATVTDQGSSVVLAPGASATFEEKAIVLDPESAVSIATSANMAVKIEKLVIAPAHDGKASYEVARAKGEILVTAKKGDVSISDGSNVTTVSEGRHESRKDPAVVPPPMSPGAASSALGITISKWTAYGAGISAAGAGVASAVNATPTSVSPH